jgi:YVTN family beta-propeller protein
MDFRLLGPLEVVTEDGAAEVGTGKRAALLTLLLINANEVLSVERLIDELWGEHPPATAAKTVQVYVSQLRKVLHTNGDMLVTRGSGYLLRLDDSELDIRRFERALAEAQTELNAGDADQAGAAARAALALWRGPALYDVAYEPFAQSEAARLGELRLIAAETRTEAELELGHHAQVVAELEGLVAEHPTRERFRAQLMLALYRSGRQADALEVYRQGTRALMDELGLEPSPQLRDLQQKILQHSPDLDGPSVWYPRARRRASNEQHAVRHQRRAARLLLAGGALLAIAAALVIAELTASDSPSIGVAKAGGDLLTALDPGTGRIVAGVTVGSAPTNVTTGAGAVWALNADDNTVSRVDLRTQAVKTFSAGALPLDLAAADDALWVVQGTSQKDWITSPAAVTRTDPVSGTAQRTTTLPQPAEATFALPPGRLVALGGGALWVVGRPGWLHRIDMKTGRVRTLRTLDARSVAGGHGQVWLRAADNRIDRLDPHTGRIAGHVTVPGSELGAMAVGSRSLWVTDAAAGTVWQIDAKSLVARTIAAEPGVDSIAVGDSAVWVGNSARGTVDRIDPKSNRVTARISVGGTPRAVAIGGNRVWVAVADAGRSAAPAAGGLRSGARVKALPAPPCGPVLTDRGGDPDVLIASDLPMRGQIATSLPMSQAVAFVLRQHRFRAGRFRVGYQSCDDATARYGTADPPKCRDNAKSYVADPAVLGVVGPMNSDCAAAMLPILNRARGGPVALVSPTNSDPSLVRPDPTAPGLLRRLYPTGQRGYARVYPSDDYEVAAGALLSKRLGGDTVFYIEDRDYTAHDPGRSRFLRAAARAGLRVVGIATFAAKSKSYRRLAERVRASGAGAVYLNTRVGANLRRLLGDLRTNLGSRVAMVGTSGFLPISLLFDQVGPAARDLHITSPGLPIDRLDAAGRRFVRAFGATQPARRVTNFDVYAAEATDVLLRAIAQSDGARASVTRALAGMRLADGPLGPVALDSRGELVSNPIAVVRPERGGGPDDVLGLDGSITEEILRPPARLVLAEPAGR